MNLLIIVEHQCHFLINQIAYFHMFEIIRASWDLQIFLNQGMDTANPDPNNYYYNLQFILYSL